MLRTHASTTLILLLTLLSLTTALPSFLLTRQSSNITDLTDPTCYMYSRTANLSTVGANSTYRSAYLLASPEGSDPARAPLDAAELALPAMTMNKTLNTECGNLTTLAFAQAAVNFTEGVVLQFKIGAVNSAGRAQSALGLAGLVGVVALGLVL